MQKLNRKCVLFEIRKPIEHWIESEEHKITKVWYRWNPVIKCWQKHRQDGPTWINCDCEIWYDRGSLTRQVVR